MVVIFAPLRVRVAPSHWMFQLFSAGTKSPSVIFVTAPLSFVVA